MVKFRRHFWVWLAPVAVSAAAFGLVVPAQAQSAGPAQLRPAAPPPAGTPVPTKTTNQPLRSLVGHPPAGGKRWIVNDPVAYGQAVKSRKWVSTPSGLAYTGCVFHVPDRAAVTNDLITLPSGARHRIEPCEYPTLAYPGSAKTTAAEPSTRGSGSAKAAPGATPPLAGPCGFGSGGTYWAASCYGSDPDWVTSMDQEYAVPTDPAKSGALLFFWGGLEDNVGNAILQDVLTWGANGDIVTNPNIWYVTPWYGANNNYVTGPSIHVGVADTIVADLTASDCTSSGVCTWTLASTDTTNGRSTSYTVSTSVSWDTVIGADMEVPSADGCVETPANGHAAFRDLVLVGNAGTITPDFGTSTPDPQCSVSIRQASNGADILWTP
jgi:hypothetical protein